MGKTGIITHFVAGYPDIPQSLEVAKGLIAGGASALEMQIPFSDPSADGPIIENACRHSLKAGCRVKDCWKLLENIRSISDIPVFLMSYGSLVFTPGVENFVKQAASCKVSGLIIPDLPPGMDEGLYKAAAHASVPAVPVIVPSVSDERLDEIIAVEPEWIYVALRSGITGKYTAIGTEQEDFLRRLHQKCGQGCLIRIMAGFGIRSPEQLRVLEPFADAAVVGSALVQAITERGQDSTYTVCRRLVEELLA